MKINYTKRARTLFCFIFGAVLMLLGMAVLILNVASGLDRRDPAMVVASFVLIVLGYDILCQRKVSMTSVSFDLEH